MTAFLSPDFLRVFIPLVGAVVAWYVNQRQRRLWEEYQRKEERYRELLLSLRGFYAATHDLSLKQQFMDQVNLCWLYCPDEVIRRAYVFLNCIKTGSDCAEDEIDQSIGELVAAVRQDLLSRRIVGRSELTHADYRYFAGNERAA